MSERSYPKHFYQAMHQDDGEAPLHVVDCILQFVQPKSVVDVGCGIADFLACFSRRGITDVQGVDLAIAPDLLRIPAAQFTAHDLTKPFRSTRRFDLVMSLEVAEHLPASAADTFIETLVSLGDVVVFSAAIPEQGGFRHINLQWQDYWAEKFQSHGFVPVDVLRDSMWNDNRIPAFYRQNMLIYVRQETLANYPALDAAARSTSRQSLSRIHPAVYLDKADPSRVTLRFTLRALAAAPRALAAAIGRRLNGRRSGN